MTEFIIVMTAFPSEEEAGPMIEEVLKRGLAACVQVMDIRSHYSWDGQLNHDKEVLILFKTRKALFQELETQITMMHPYEVPEILAVDVDQASMAYSGWMKENTKEPAMGMGFGMGAGPAGGPVFSMSSTEALLEKLGSGLQEHMDQDYYTNLYSSWEEDEDDEE